MRGLIDAYGLWPSNTPQPFSTDDCLLVLEQFGSLTLPTRDEAKALTKHLLGKWPWLSKTEQDLRVYIADTAAIFCAFSLDAAKHVLDPVRGPTWERDMPPAGSALRRELQAFDGRRQAAVRAAQWMLAEADRRRLEVERDAQIDRERAERKAKGLGPLPSIGEVLRK